VERVRLPPRGARLDAREAALLPGRVIEAVFGASPPQPAADILVGAVLTPFYDPQLRPRKTYDDTREPWFTPHWLPAYRHRFLVREGRTAEAEAHLAALDAAASMPPPEVSDPLLAAAARHVIQRARVLAEVCRARRLPERWSCLFWPRTDNVFRRGPPDATPRGLVEAMGIMESRPPELGSHYRPLEGA
jgi:hypothetical protein